MSTTERSLKKVKILTGSGALLGHANVPMDHDGEEITAGEFLNRLAANFNLKHVQAMRRQMLDSLSKMSENDLE